MTMIKITQTCYRAAAALLFGLLLVACGSGGGDRSGINNPMYSIAGTVSGVQEAVTLSLSLDATQAVSSVPATGAFSFTNLTLGTYLVTPSLSGYSFDPSVTSVTVDGKDTTVTIPTILAKVNIAPTYSISGTVTGAVQQGVLIALSGSGATYTTGPDGKYSFPGLVAGSYIITPSLAGYDFTEPSLIVSDLHADTPNQDFVATKQPAPTYSLSGTVTGGVQQNVLITLNNGNTTLTSAGGTYSFPALVAGSYTVTPSKLGYTFSPVPPTVAISNAPVSGINFTANGHLNDTGITNMQCYKAASDVLGTCTSTGVGTATALNNQQDGMVGRDVSVTDPVPSDGNLGFSFTKVCNSGELAGTGNCSINAGLGNTLNDWGCTQDNVTGLMWEVKTTDGGLRDWSIGYTNYDSTSALQISGPANRPPYTAPTQTQIDDATNSIGFKNSVNTAGLCGHHDWRLPTADELQSIVDYGVNVQGLATPVPTVDTHWFPNTQSGWFWSSSPYVGNASSAWFVDFGNGSVYDGDRSGSYYVRLVRAGQ